MGSRWLTERACGRSEGREGGGYGLWRAARRRAEGARGGRLRSGEGAERDASGGKRGATTAHPSSVIRLIDYMSRRPPHLSSHLSSAGSSRPSITRSSQYRRKYATRGQKAARSTADVSPAAGAGVSAGAGAASPSAAPEPHPQTGRPRGLAPPSAWRAHPQPDRSRGLGPALASSGARSAARGLAGLGAPSTPEKC